MKILINNHGNHRNEGVEVALTQEKRNYTDSKKGRRKDSPLKCLYFLEKVRALLEQWIKKKDKINLPQIGRAPTSEEKQNPLYCNFHRKVLHSTMDCYTL